MTGKTFFGNGGAYGQVGGIVPPQPLVPVAPAPPQGLAVQLDAETGRLVMIWRLADNVERYGVMVFDDAGRTVCTIMTAGRFCAAEATLPPPLSCSYRVMVWAVTNGRRSEAASVEVSLGVPALSPEQIAASEVGASAVKAREQVLAELGVALGHLEQISPALALRAVAMLAGLRAAIQEHHAAAHDSSADHTARRRPITADELASEFLDLMTPDGPRRIPIYTAPAPDPEPTCGRCDLPFAPAETPIDVREHPQQAEPTTVHEGCLREGDQPWKCQYQPFKARS